MNNTVLFSIYEFGESFLANGLGLVLFPILLYDFGIDIYKYTLLIGVSNLIGVFINIFLLKAPKNVINTLFFFSALTFLTGFGLLTKGYAFALFFGIFIIIHLQGLLFYQISILETTNPKVSSSLSSSLGYIGYALAVVCMFFIKSQKTIILIGLFIYITCGFLFYRFSDKNIRLQSQNLHIFSEKRFLKYTISLLSLSIAPQFFNNIMSMYLKTYLHIDNKNIYLLMGVGLLCAIGSSILLSKFWKKEEHVFYITVICWILVYMVALMRFFIHIEYNMLYGILLAVLGGSATGLFWTFFKAITVLKFYDKDVGIRISLIYGLSTSIGPILFYLISFINTVVAFLSIILLLMTSLVFFNRYQK